MLWSVCPVHQIHIHPHHCHGLEQVQIWYVVQEEYEDLLGISAVIISENMREYSPGSYEGVDMLVVLMRSISDGIFVHNGRVCRFQQHKERGRDVPKWDGARDVVGAGRRNDMI